MGCNEAQKLADPNCPCALRVHVDFRANLSAAEWLNTGRICLSPCEGKLPLLDVISKANCQLDAKRSPAGNPCRAGHSLAASELLRLSEGCQR